MTSPSPSEPRTPRLYHAALPPVLALVLAGTCWAVLIVLASVLYALGLSQLAAASAGQLACLTIVLAVTRRAGGDRATLGLRWPATRHLVAGVLIGAGLWYVNLVLVLVVRAPTESPALTEAAGQSALFPTLIMLGAVPAVCEEVLFRGVLARAFASRLPAFAAIVLSAVTFSAYHLNLVQALPTFVLGLVLAFLALRARSIVPGMIAHALNNTIAVVIARDVLGGARWLEDEAGVALAVAAGLVIVGLALAARPARAPAA